MKQLFENNMKDAVSISFAGDIALDKYLYKAWEDEKLISEDILEFMNASDHVIIDVEGAVSEYEQDPDAKGTDAMLHTTHPEGISLFKKIGADVWCINNNHISDIGPRGIEETLKYAKESGALVIGGGMNPEEAARPVYFDGAGGVGVFAVGYRPGCKPAGEDKPGILEWSDMETIQANIDIIKKKCRWCIVLVHGGEEFVSMPMPYIRDRYIKFLDMGADIVVGHHPHVISNYETFPGKAIFYSIGNFLFDTNYQRTQLYTDVGMVLKLILSEDGYKFDTICSRLDREKVKLTGTDLPCIFRDIQQDEYDRLIPLVAKAFISAIKKRQLFLYPEKYQSYGEKEWEEHFMDPNRLYRMPYETLDFRVVYPLAKTAEKGEWKNSKLEDVKQYILAQI